MNYSPISEESSFSSVQEESERKRYKRKREEKSYSRHRRNFNRRDDWRKRRHYREDDEREEFECRRQRSRKHRRISRERSRSKERKLRRSRSRSRKHHKSEKEVVDIDNHSFLGEILRNKKSQDCIAKDKELISSVIQTLKKNPSADNEKQKHSSKSPHTPPLENLPAGKLKEVQTSTNDGKKEATQQQVTKESSQAPKQIQQAPVTEEQQPTNEKEHKKCNVLELPMPPVVTPVKKDRKIKRKQPSRDKPPSVKKKEVTEKEIRADFSIPPPPHPEKMSTVYDLKSQNAKIVKKPISELILHPPPPLPASLRQKIDTQNKSSSLRPETLVNCDSIAKKLNTKDKQSEHFKEIANHLKTNSVLTPMVNPSPDSVKARPTVIKQKSPRMDLQGLPLSRFKILEQVGEGTYGKVFKAINISNKEIVAMKYIRMENEKEGFPLTCIREIMILQKMNHPNVIGIFDVISASKRNGTYLVFEYMNHDLHGLLESDSMNFNESTIFHIMKQILQGIEYCHKLKIIHRDLKTSNILINSSGIVKLADFGLARFWEAERPYTNRVISLWYRPIELLLGEEKYGPPIDIWSIGCVMCELFKRTPLFPFNDETLIVNAIYKTCGVPDISWPDVHLLPRYKTLKPNIAYHRILKEKMKPYAPPLAVDLMDKLLTLNPKHRITALEALNSDWISKMNREIIPPLYMKLPPVDCFEMNIRNKRRGK